MYKLYFCIPNPEKVPNDTEEIDIGDFTTLKQAIRGAERHYESADGDEESPYPDFYQIKNYTDQSIYWWTTMIGQDPSYTYYEINRDS